MANVWCQETYIEEMDENGKIYKTKVEAWKELNLVHKVDDDAERAEGAGGRQHGIVEVGSVAEFEAGHGSSFMVWTVGTK